MIVQTTRGTMNRHAATPETAFVISPVAYLETERAAEGTGLEVLGFYHSHPDAAPDPSVTDLAYAWPNTLYLVASVWQGEPGALGAYVLTRDGQGFSEVAVTEEPHG